MTIYRAVIRCAMLVLPLVLLAQDQSAHAQKKNPYACKEPDPTALCTAANTCSGSCSVDVKRTAQAASATPSFPGAKGNSTFCVKVGTQVTWKSDTKHQGFSVDMGPNSPFDSPDIIGGSDKSVTTTAQTPGCVRYSAGACLSGAIYGMCGNGTAEVVILK
jgi:plastocyanin